MADNSQRRGYLKNAMSKSGAVIFIGDNDEAKHEYNADELLSAQIDSTRFVCINGDFFKVISEGEICFLQKASDASAIPIHNGTEAIFIKKSEGRVNDYFFYDKEQRLTLVTKKNKDAIVAGVFASCTAAITKAGATGSDLAQLRAAVDVYNRRNE